MIKFAKEENTQGRLAHGSMPASVVRDILLVLVLMSLESFLNEESSNKMIDPR